MAASSARRDPFKTLHSSIEDKTEPDAKRRKLDPANSRAGTNPEVINRDIEPALRILIKPEFIIANCEPASKGPARLMS